MRALLMARFAAGGVEQEAKRNRKIHFLGKERDGFLVIVLEDLEILLFQVGDDALVFVPNRCKQVYEGDFRLDRGGLTLR